MVNKLSLLIIMLTISLCVKAESPFVIYTENFRPFNFLKKDGAVAGICTDFVRSIFDKSNIKAQIRLVPWARAYSGGLNQKNSGVFCTLRTPQREPLFHWLGPLYETSFNVYKRSDRKDIKVKNLADLNQYSFGVNASDGDIDLLLAAGVARENIVEMQMPILAKIDLLSKNRFDMFISTEESLKMEIKNMPGVKLDYFEYVISLPGTTQFYLALNKETSEDTLNKLTASYQKLMRQNIIETLENRYLSEPDEN